MKRAKYFGAKAGYAECLGEIFWLSSSILVACTLFNAGGATDDTFALGALVCIRPCLAAAESSCRVTLRVAGQTLLPA